MSPSKVRPSGRPLIDTRAKVTQQGAAVRPPTARRENTAARCNGGRQADSRASTETPGTAATANISRFAGVHRTCPPATMSRIKSPPGRPPTRRRPPTSGYRPLHGRTPKRRRPQQQAP